MMFSVNNISLFLQLLKVNYQKAKKHVNVRYIINYVCNTSLHSNSNTYYKFIMYDFEHF